MAERPIVAVTGASAGVGRAVVRAFAAEGADVALLARGAEGLDAAREEVERMGRRALVVPCDVADASRVEEAAERIEADLGPLEIWVNDAMVTVMSEVREMRPEEFRRVTEVTYLGTVYGTQAALRRMLPRDRGTIVQVGSALSYRAIPLQSAYCASKFAVRGFTDSLRVELLHHGSNVHLTMVQLPAVNTPQFGWSRCRCEHHPQPVPPIYQPEVAADAVVFASRARRREVWVGTQASAIIVGNKLAAGLGDRYLARTGYDAQFLEEPLAPDRPDNLFQPVPGDRGARGRFDDRARPRDAKLWLAKHAPSLAAAGAFSLAAVLMAWLRG